MFPSHNDPLPSHDSYPSLQQQTYSKRQQFRMSIRRRQIQQIKKQIRANFLLSTKIKDHTDIKQLMKIDLNKVIKQLKSIGVTQQNIRQMFLYATSKNCDHLYTLFDEKVVGILINAMVWKDQNNNRNTEQVQFIDNEKGNIIKWDRKIFWILTNYTQQSTVLRQKYLQNLYLIANQVYSHVENKNSNNNRIFNLEQTQQNIVLSLSNLLIQSSNCRQIIISYPNLFYRILQRFYQRKPRLSDMIKKNKDNIPKLLTYYCQLIHNIYSVIQYEQIKQQQQKLTLKQIRRILFALTNQRTMTQDDKKIVLLFIDSINRLFGHTLDNQPKYILIHKSQFWKYCEWFELFMRTQKATKKSDQIIISFINMLQIVYGPNIPEDMEKQVSKFYKQFFQKKVGLICTSVFQNKNQEFHLHVLGMLQPIMMQQHMAQMIINQYLPIVSNIFLHIKNSPFALKKQALICIINLMKSTIYNNSTTQPHVLQILLANKIADILAYNIWNYTDIQLNLQLVQGISILLTAQTNQYGSKIGFQTAFKQAGGTLRMEKLLEESGNEQLKSQVSRLLDCMKEDQQQMNDVYQNSKNL